MDIKRWSSFYTKKQIHLNQLVNAYMLIKSKANHLKIGYITHTAAKVSSA